MGNKSDCNNIAIIIGAGPAGLTAAYELLTRTGIRPIVLEQSFEIGGISRTVNHNGNRIDIGGHRFFSKSKRVTDWWEKMLPLQGAMPGTHGLPVSPHGPDPEQVDKVMLVRERLSRIYFLGKFFPYPLELTARLLRELGYWRSLRIGLDYLKARAYPIRPEKSLEDFLKNRFGNHLYQTFFRTYTEKLWGVPCSEIDSEWGSQRIKGLSLRKALFHSLARKELTGEAKKVETSLIGHFHYPKFGPGQMWEQVAAEIRGMGGEVFTGTKVMSVEYSDQRVSRVTAIRDDGSDVTFEDPDWVMSSMPVKELFQNETGGIPSEVGVVSNGLRYRDFITVGILCTRFTSGMEALKDNWLYIQEPGVRLGRIQIFNNWSPHMVADSSQIWLGLEYFVNEDEEFWRLPDFEIANVARGEISSLGLVDGQDIIDSVVIRQPKAYPAYFGTYDQMDVIRKFVDSVQNLFLIGRNGMHRYNNQDHSMLSAMTAVDIINDPSKAKSTIWAVNTESEHHEG